MVTTEEREKALAEAREIGPAMVKAVECKLDGKPIDQALAIEVAKECFQPSVDEMLGLPQYRQYVQQHKLELLLGEKGRTIDFLLNKGILRDRPATGKGSQTPSLWEQKEKFGLN